MEAKFLLPHSLKKVGWTILIPSLVLGLMVMFDNFTLEMLDGRMLTIYNGEYKSLISSENKGRWFQMIEVNFTQTIVGLLNLIGLLFVAFAKEKVEDEFIRQIRLNALVMAIYINYAILIFCFIFFYNLDFLMVMIFNIFTILIIFIIIFNRTIFQIKKSVKNEK